MTNSYILSAFKCPLKEQECRCATDNVQVTITSCSGRKIRLGVVADREAHRTVRFAGTDNAPTELFHWFTTKEVVCLSEFI